MSDPQQLLRYILSLPVPLRVDSSKRQQRKLSFASSVLVQERSIADYEVTYAKHMARALAAIYQLRMRDGIELDVLLYRAMRTRRTLLSSQQYEALRQRLAFLCQVASQRLNPSDASLAAGGAADMLTQLERLRVDPDSSIVGLRAAALDSVKAVHCSVAPPSIDIVAKTRANSDTTLQSAAPSSSGSLSPRSTMARAVAFGGGVVTRSGSLLLPEWLTKPAPATAAGEQCFFVFGVQSSIATTCTV